MQCFRSLGFALATLAVLANPVFASDMPMQPSPSATPSTWSCGAFERVTKGLLYDSAGFFGTKQWSTMTFVGCSQPKGGWDWNVIGFVPLGGNGVANEFDLEGGYTFVSGPWSLRIGTGYWNFEPFLGTRFQIWDNRVKAAYRFEVAPGISVTPWAQLNYQELYAPGLRDHDFNVGAGGVLKMRMNKWSTLVIEAAHFHHVKSFGPSKDVTAVTVEVPFDLGKYNGFAVSAGPWWRGTWGNILKTPGNHEFNNSLGFKISAFN